MYHKTLKWLAIGIAPSSKMGNVIGPFRGDSCEGGKDAKDRKS